MGFLDFLKGKEYREESSDIKEESIEESSELNGEETVEEIVRSAVGEIEEETEEKVEEDVVVEVVENVTKIEKEVNDDVERSVTEKNQEQDNAELCEESEADESNEEETAEETEEAEEAEEIEETEAETVSEEPEVTEETKEAEDNSETEAEESAAEPQDHKKGFFARLMEGLEKTRKNIFGGIDSVLGSFTKIDDDLFDELEESLIMADLGVDTTLKIIENLKKRVKKERAEDPSLIKGMLEDEITAILEEGVEEEFEVKTPCVMLVIGVNGVGKTTTIGKLAANYKAEGKKVLLAAADTFRAAAIDQLKIWGERSDIDVICHEENSDPAAVVFDAVNAAKSRKADVLICDTAGRLHNKKNLMEELKKIAKVINREYPEAN